MVFQDGPGWDIEWNLSPTIKENYVYKLTERDRACAQLINECRFLTGIQLNIFLNSKNFKERANFPLSNMGFLVKHHIVRPEDSAVPFYSLGPLGEDYVVKPSLRKFTATKVLKFLSINQLLARMSQTIDIKDPIERISTITEENNGLYIDSYAANTLLLNITYKGKQYTVASARNNQDDIDAVKNIIKSVKTKPLIVVAANQDIIKQCAQDLADYKIRYTTDDNLFLLKKNKKELREVFYKVEDGKIVPVNIKSWE